MIETNDGRTAAGIVQRETSTAVTLVNQTGTIIFARDAIKKLERLEISMMPPGLLSALSEPQAANLVAYLQTTGQVPLPK